jgi:hypothetical protein
VRKSSPIQEALDGSRRIIHAMPALETELEKALADAPQQEAAPPQAEPAVEAQQQSTEGPVPEVSGGAAAVAGTASEQAFGTTAGAPSSKLGAGMFRHHEYKAACIAAGTPEKWDDRYWHGHTEAKQWSQPYEGRFDNVFALKRHQSASQAVKDFIKGPTISSFRIIHVALELDEVRHELGDRRFDELFGSKDHDQDDRIPPAQRLQITGGMYTIPFREQMMQLAANEDVKPEQEEVEAPAVAAGIEEQPQHAVTGPQPAPEMIADELGVQREQELV